MSDSAEHLSEEERELMRRAEAIADGSPNAVLGMSPEASSPLLRQMSVLAEVAAAFGGVSSGGRADDPDGDHLRDGALFRWGPLVVQKPLGEGSFGQVYAAWDSRLRREVALKLRRDESTSGVRRWLDEARAQAQVRHPNVLTVYGADEHDGRAGMWTDLVHGRDLEAILQQQGSFSERETATIGLELCAALAAVHARGLVHGDVKTRNVMREEGGDRPGRIVLMDFGSAHEASLALTAGRGSSVGTPLAMAPEVLRGEAATASSDLYSLGVLLFRLATGRYPVEAASLDELRAKHDRGERLSLRTLRPSLTRDFVRVIERALDPDPRRRLRDAAEMERALAIQPHTTSRRGWAVASMAAVALAVVVGVLVFRDRHAAPRRPAKGTGAVVPATGEVKANGAERAADAPEAPGAGNSMTGSSATQLALQAEATLYRVRAGETMPLVTGGEIEPGDRLYLTASASEAVNAYVLDEDGSGRVTALFPCAGATASNPLPAGSEHRLPGSGPGTALHWLVTSAEGQETFLVVLSREPLDALEAAVASLPAVTSAAGLAFATLEEGDLRRLRGVTGLTRDPAPKSSEKPGRLTTLARELAARPDAASFWIRLVQVSNPRP